MAMTNVEKQRRWRQRHSSEIETRIANAEKQRRWRKRHIGEIKAEVLTHYGNGKCACVRCGESRMACLSIDHIEGEGNKKRKKLGNFYSWLKRNGYPEGYQTLCMNCQFVKRFDRGEQGGRPFTLLGY